MFIPELATMVPMRDDRMNCARNTMQLTMAMSVPMPRTWVIGKGVINCGFQIVLTWSEYGTVFPPASLLF